MMKNFKIILLVLFILPVISFAQKNELMLGLSIGINNPLGDYASSDYILNDDNTIEAKGQFAKLGTAFDFSANYRVGYYLGFAGRFMGGTNKINTIQYSEIINSLLSENYETTVSSKGWGSMGIMFGGYFVIPANDFYFDLRIMGGYTNLFSPEISYYITDQTTKEESLFVEEKYSAGGFSYDLGIGIKYKFASNKYLLLNGDYIGASIKKQQIKTINPITQEDTYVDMDVNYQNITVTVGLGYIF